MRLILLGFGTVGQGLAELLLTKRDQLKKEYSLDWQVVGIADMLKGSIANGGGIDLNAALSAARSGKNLTEVGDAFGGDALAMVATDIQPK